MLEKPLDGCSGVPLFTEARAVCSGARSCSDMKLRTSLPQDPTKHIYAALQVVYEGLFLNCVATEPRTNMQHRKAEPSKRVRGQGEDRASGQDQGRGGFLKIKEDHGGRGGWAKGGCEGVEVRQNKLSERQREEVKRCVRSNGSWAKDGEACY